MTSPICKTCGHEEYVHGIGKRPCQMFRCSCKKFTPKSNNSQQPLRTNLVVSNTKLRGGKNKEVSAITNGEMLSSPATSKQLPADTSTNSETNISDEVLKEYAEEHGCKARKDKSAWEDYKSFTDTIFNEEFEEYIKKAVLLAQKQNEEEIQNLKSKFNLIMKYPLSDGNFDRAMEFVKQKESFKEEARKEQQTAFNSFIEDIEKEFSILALHLYHTECETCLEKIDNFPKIIQELAQKYNLGGRMDKIEQLEQRVKNLEWWVIFAVIVTFINLIFF